MRYIKTYESTIKKYWLIPTDDRFEKSMKEIGCDIGQLKSKSLTGRDLIKEHEYIFVYYNSDNDWSWTNYYGELKDEIGEKNNYDFQGTVNIVGNDPEAEKATTKYNL